MRVTRKHVLSHFVSSVVLLTMLVFVTPVRGQRSSVDENAIYDPSLFNALEYRMIGPYRGGRSTAVAGVPDRPHTYYHGTTGGGVWKTTDDGQTWVNISDGYFGGSIGLLPSPSRIGT